MFKFLKIWVLLAAICGVGLTPIYASRQTPELSGNVTLYFFGDRAEEEAYQAVVTGFNKLYPQIKVNLTVLPDGDNYLKKLTTDFAAGQPPDVFLINYREYVAYAKRNVLTPIQPYLEKSNGIKASDFYTPSQTAFTRNGVLQCMPQNASSLVTYYNKNLFKAAGLPFPTEAWTWDDFLSAAKALTKDGTPATKQHGAGMQVQFYRFMPFIWSNGGDIADNLDAPKKLLVDSPEAIGALKWFSELQTLHKVMPNEVEERSRSSQNRFLDGRLGMFFQSRRFTTTARTITKFDWDVAPLPKSKQFSTVLHADGFCMSKAGKNQAATWAFIEYAVSVAGQGSLVKTGRIVPLNKSVAESTDFLDPSQKPANSKIFLSVIPTIRLSPNGDSWAETESELTRQFAAAFYGNKTPEQAAADMIKNTERLMVKP
jgi:multiple sugar transport system substrate-binding protein